MAVWLNPVEFGGVDWVPDSEPEKGGFGACDCRAEILWAAVIAGCGAAPVVELPEHPFDPDAAFAAARVVSKGPEAQLAPWDAGSNVLVFVGCSEPTRVIPLVCQKSLCLWKASQHCPARQ